MFWFRSTGEVLLLTTGDVAKLKTSGFNYNTRTVFLVHGYLGVGNDVIFKIKDGKYIYLLFYFIFSIKICCCNFILIPDILTKWDVNVIFVDWVKAATGMYLVVQSRIDDIANQVTSFVDFITDQNYPIDNVQFVGFSLGAHLSGLVGRRVKNGKIYSIIGNILNQLFYWRIIMI